MAWKRGALQAHVRINSEHFRFLCSLKISYCGAACSCGIVLTLVWQAFGSVGLSNWGRVKIAVLSFGADIMACVGRCGLNGYRQPLCGAVLVSEGEISEHPLSRVRAIRIGYARGAVCSVLSTYDLWNCGMPCTVCRRWSSEFWSSRFSQRRLTGGGIRPGSASMLGERDGLHCGTSKSQGGLRRGQPDHAILVDRIRGVMIHWTILCDGAYVRSWTLSRQSYPKQFAIAVGEDTMFQASAKRPAGPVEGQVFLSPLVLSKSDLRFIVTEQLSEIGIAAQSSLSLSAATPPRPFLPAHCILQRPVPRQCRKWRSTISGCPMPPFCAAVRKCLDAIAAGKLLTFRIRPACVETGYGWLELTVRHNGSGNPIVRSGFTKKPEAKRACEMRDADNSQRDAGIFPIRAVDIIAAFIGGAPDLLAPLEHAVEERRPTISAARSSAPSRGRQVAA